MALSLQSEFQFENGQISKNRVVVPPMASQTADSEGFVTPETIRHYDRLTRSGAGIVFVEYSHIHKSGRGEPHQLGVDGEDKIPGLTQLAKTVKRSGALAGLQIVHVGAKTSSDFTGQKLIAPSALSVPVKGRDMETPDQASLLEVSLLKEWYRQAASRGYRSGFDIVELHAAHGYGLNQWLSPLTNRREDTYGGSANGRFQLLREVVLQIRSDWPGKVLAVRLPAEDHFEEGIHVSEMQWIVKELESLGVSLIDVSSGIGGWRRPKGRAGEGYLVSDAAKLKRATELPVIGVGGIKSAGFINESLNGSKLDFAAVGREILADPERFQRCQLKTFR